MLLVQMKTKLNIIPLRSLGPGEVGTFTDRDTYIIFGCNPDDSGGIICRTKPKLVIEIFDKRFIESDECTLIAELKKSEECIVEDVFTMMGRLDLIFTHKKTRRKYAH